VKIVAAHYRTGARVEFTVEKGRAKSREFRGRGDALVGPGLVDLQNNGYAGVDFNRPETTPEQIAAAIRVMWTHGCATVLPTVITAAPERLEHLLRTIVAAREIDGDVRASVPGIHLEGPFISPIDGARGAHPHAHVRPIDRKLWRRLQRAAEGLIRLVTVAPELRGAPAFIRELRGEGILPAIGHTLATRRDINAASEAGALVSTHLGNGCPQMLHRHENPILAQLGEDRLAATFIADGIHLPPEVLRSFIRAKSAERTILVTDAMAAAGAPPGAYTIGDIQVEVGRDRVVRQPGSPNFAGSALTMDAAVENTVRHGALGLADAWDAASTWPARLLAPTRVAPSTLIARAEGGTFEPIALIRGQRVLWSRED
jgi:N-acetylglucosamine-6-phosphate deacetylase